jgi:hypothetical protein
LVEERLTFFAALYRVADHPDQGMLFLYGTIVILSIIAYKLGFSHKLPLLKSIIIYLFLFLGCTILSFLAVFLPVAEGLVVICAVLLVYRIRRYFDHHKNKKSIET